MYFKSLFRKWLFFHLALIVAVFFSVNIHASTSCSEATSITLGAWETDVFGPGDYHHFYFTAPSDGTIRLDIENNINNPCVLGWVLYANGGNCTSTLFSGIVDKNDTYSFEDQSVTAGIYKIKFTNNGGTSGLSFYKFKVNFYPTNQCPDLSNDSYTPNQDGTTDDDYYFYVFYDDSDNNPPDRKRVYINGDYYNMTLFNGHDYAGTYRYGPINLPVGQTKYYFSFEDENGCSVRYPESGDFDGPIIVEPNNCFTMSNPQVTPLTGSPTTTFIYSVHYNDPDGDIPTAKYVNIDGTDYTMSFKPGSGSASNGTYEYDKSDLPEGFHEYYFYFEDGHGCIMYYPGISSPDPISGPIVSKPNLTLNNVDSSPRRAGPGQTINVSGYVKNDSNVQVDPAEHRIFVNQIQDGQSFTSNSIPVKTFSTGSINAKSQVSFDEAIIVPDSLPAGWDYFVVVEVDWQNLIQEETETEIDNNRFTPIIGYAGQELGQHNRSPNSGDPVNTAIGNFTYDKTDLVLPGRGLNVNFTRYYNSQGGYESPIGVYWSHSYNMYIRTTPYPGTDDREVVYGDGKRHLYLPDGSNGFIPPEGIYNTLVKNADNTYTLTQKDQVKYNFDTDNRLYSIVDRNGNTITLTYTGGNLTKITDTVGREINIDYNNIGGADRIISVQGPVRPAVTYGYDTYGNLTSVTDARGNTTQYFYTTDHDDKHLLSRINNALGKNEIRNYYGDKDGNENTASNFHGYFVVKQLDAYDNETLYEYDLVERITKVTGPDLEVTEHHYDDYYRFTKEIDPKGYIIEFHYDVNGNMDWVKDKNGKTTSYTDYDERGNIEEKTDPLVLPASTGIVTKIEYNSFNDPTKKIEAFGTLNHEWTYTYDSNGNLKTETDSELYETSYTYNAYGQVKTKTDANGNITEYFYEDAWGNLTKVKVPATPGCGTNETIYTYDEAGRKLTMTDALGNVTQYHYDNNDNLEWVIDPEDEQIVYIYDENNNKTSMQNRRGYTTTYEYDDKDRLKIVRDPLLKETTTEYDAFDRKTKVTDKWGNATNYEYDEVGNLKKVTNADDKITQYEYDPNGNKIKMTDADLNVWEYGHDENNRLIWEEDPFNNRTQYEHNEVGWVKKITDANLKETTFEYYKNGRLKQVTDPEGGQSIYTYDGMGNRLTEKDARLETVQYEYDSLNRLVKIIDRNEIETVFTYNCMNMTSKKDGNNDTINFTEYDKNNRLKTKTYPGPSSVSFTYDENGNTKTMIDSLGTTTYAYDELDRILSVEDPFLKKVEYTYDTAINKRTIIYPDGKEVLYEYDSLNRLWKVTDWLGYTTTYAYDNRGNLSGVSNTKGTHVDYTYDISSRLVTAVDKTSGDATISSFSYVLDKLGNRKSATMDVPLAPVFNNKSISADYDPESQITDWGSASFGFDDAGKQADKTEGLTTTTYTYNLDDRLTNISDGTDTWQYQYNGSGDRLAKSVNGTKTRYVLDLNGDMSKVLCETDASGNITAYYVYGAGLLYKITPADDRYHYHFDPLGSTIALTDETEATTDKYAYDPFGKLLNKEGTTENSFRYVGQYGVMDEENGLLFMRARFYDPETKSFLSRDPVKGEIENTQSLQPYLYGRNNPVLNIDPSGEIAAGTTVPHISWWKALPHTHMYNENGFFETWEITVTYTYDESANFIDHDYYIDDSYIEYTCPVIESGMSKITTFVPETKGKGFRLNINVGLDRKLNSITGVVVYENDQSDKRVPVNDQSAKRVPVYVLKWETLKQMAVERKMSPKTVFLGILTGAIQ